MGGAPVGGKEGGKGLCADRQAALEGKGDLDGLPGVRVDVVRQGGGLGGGIGALEGLDGFAGITGADEGGGGEEGRTVVLVYR